MVSYSVVIYVRGADNLDVTDNIITGTNGATLVSRVLGIAYYDDNAANNGGSVTGNTISFVDTGIDIEGALGGPAIVVNGNIVTDVDFTDTFSPSGVYFEPDAALTLDFVISGSDVHDELVGAAGSDNFSGLDGADYFEGKGGNDQLSGGLGSDTAAYAGARADYTITTTTDGNGRVTGFLSVKDDVTAGGDEGTDTLTSVEALQFAGSVLSLADPVQLFDDNDVLVGTFTTIQAAINAAGTDYRIEVGAGTYNEALTVGVAGLEINAAPGATLQGDWTSSNGVTGPLNVWLKTAASYSSYPASNGIIVNADGLTINGLTITGFGQGIVLGNGTDGTTLSGVVLQSNFAGIHKPGSAAVTNFTMLNGQIIDGHLGMDIVRDAGSGGSSTSS